jgi:endonuclease/exonuclease/phosphatase family metal-dependent hydrolase
MTEGRASLRVLSYNIRSLRDDKHAVAGVIRACAPDVVCIQEAPRFLRWRSKRAAIARGSGLVVATADRPAGLMLMTSLRVKILRTGFRLLSKSPDLHQRGVCWADVEAGGARWRIASIHLSLDADERLRHQDELWACLTHDGLPLVVAGDVNETPDGPVWADFTHQLVDAAVAAGRAANTFRAADPHKRIDGIFVDPSVAVASCRVVDDVPGVQIASDHLPVLAELQPAVAGDQLKR